MPADAPGHVALGPLPLYPIAASALGVVLLVTVWPGAFAAPDRWLFNYLVADLAAPHPPLLVFGALVDQSTGRGPGLWVAPLLWLIRLPLPLLLLSAFGAVRAARGIRRSWRDPARPCDLDPAVSLSLAFILFLLGIHAFNGSPGYDGNDGLLLAVPLLSLLAAGGVAAARDLLRAAGAKARPVFIGAVLVLSLSARLGAGVHGAGFVNALVWGSGGATALGLPVESVPTLPAPVLEALATPPLATARVAFRASAADAPRITALVERLQAVGALPSTLTVCDPAAAQFLVDLAPPDAPGGAVAKAPGAVVEHRGRTLAAIYEVAAGDALP